MGNKYSILVDFNVIKMIKIAMIALRVIEYAHIDIQKKYVYSIQSLDKKINKKFF